MSIKKTTPDTNEQHREKLAAYWQGKADGLASHAFTVDQCQSYSDSLSDFLCWIEGFQAGGGKYSPQSIEPLRDLNIRLKEMFKNKITAAPLSVNTTIPTSTK